MCCFSRPVRHVAGTKIFARVDDHRQCVVYAMHFSAKEDLAMVLPIPTPAGSPEDAVAFVSLEAYGNFFVDMERAFPRMEAASAGARSLGARPRLVVHRVGAFDASFVPTQDDFERLDERFRIPKEVWATIPQYDDFGFAVFKLRKGRKQKVHPMAFWFPTRSPERIFFPTVHIHDGAWTPTAGFDHALYCQVPEHHPVEDRESQWMPSRGPAHRYMSLDLTEGLVLRDEPLYKRGIFGNLVNEDVYV